jgi:dipeptidyl-peptidase-4
MKPLRSVWLQTGALALFLFPSAANLAQQQEKLTIEWIFGGGLRETMAYPVIRWLGDSRLAWYDLRKPPAARILEAIDPATGRLEKLFDPDRALASLNGLRPGKDSIRVLPFPAEIDKGVRRALFTFDGDIYLLDFKTSTFLRATQTPEAEMCILLSPDGNKVSFVRSNNLFLYDLNALEELRLTSDGSDSVRNGTLSWVYWEEVFGRRDIGYWWSPDSKAIAYFRTDESGVSVQHYVDFKPWTPRLITQRYPKVGERNPAVTVGIIDLESRKTQWVNLSDQPHEYILRAEWLPDSKHLSVQTLNRPQTQLDLFFAERKSGAVRHVLTERDTGWVNIMDDLHFLKDGQNFLWPSERSGYLHLYQYTLAGEPVNQVTRGDWSLRSGGGVAFWVQQALVGVDESEGWVYFTALEKSPLERHLYRVKIDGSGMRRLSTEEGTHGVTFSPDMQFYIDRFSAADRPPVVGLYRKDGSLVRVLAGPNSEVLTKFGLQFPSFLTIRARDGFPLPAQIMKPKDFSPARKYPVIFYVYGGPSAPEVLNQWQSDVFWYNILLENGFIVMSVDNRVATGISKTLENLSVRHFMSTVELNDLVDAVRWVKGQPFVDSTRIGVWGWSGGGTSTMLAMTRSKEFKAGIAIAGVSDMRFYDTKWAEAVMKTEEVNRAGFEESSLLRYAKDLHGKLMIVHGTYDDNVHIQNAWAFIDELIKANKLYELAVYPMRMHGIGDPPARIHLYTTMLDFWKRNL